MQEMGTRRSPPPGSAQAVRAASTERPTKPTGRAYTDEYKRRILDEIIELRISGERGAIGALLRREGLNSAAINRWEKAASAGRLKAQKRGRRPKQGATSAETEQLKRRVAQLEKELKKAEIIIDVQKKLGALLGLEAADVPDPKDGTP